MGLFILEQVVLDTAFSANARNKYAAELNVNASPTDTYSSDNRISERSFSLVKFNESVNHG